MTCCWELDGCRLMRTEQFKDCVLALVVAPACSGGPQGSGSGCVVGSGD